MFEVDLAPKSNGEVVRSSECVNVVFAWFSMDIVVLCWMGMSSAAVDDNLSPNFMLSL